MTAKIKTVPKSTSHKYKPKGVSSHQFQKVHWPYLPAWAVVSFGAIVAGTAEFGAAGAIAGSIAVAVATIAIFL
jgi:hypothetical protein